MKPWFFTFLVFAVNLAFAQQDSIPVPEGCTELAIDEERNLILLDPERSLVHKVLAPYYDSVITAGGQGVRTEGLLRPTRVVAFSRQRIYVLDEDQRKAVILSANLRPAEAIDFLDPDRPDEGPNFPVDIAVSPAGELYVLDGLEGRVYMYDSFGNLRLDFGGQDYAEGSLYKPTSLAIDPSNRQVWVLDTLERVAKVYSRFGEYLYSEDSPAKDDVFHASRLAINPYYRVFWGTKTRSVQESSGKLIRKAIPLYPGQYFTTVALAGSTLYELHGNAVHLQHIK